MLLRDIAFALFMLVALPACARQPWIGILVWSWIGYMNPHRFVWGFARMVPWALLVAVVTLAGILFTQDRKPIPWLRETYLLAMLWAVFTITTVTAMFPWEAAGQWVKLSKVLLFTFLTLMFFQDRLRLRYLFLVIGLSLGLYGLKGGLWALATGGQHKVVGPEGSFFGGNTAVGTAILMAMPMLYYLQKDEPRRWLRRVMLATFWVGVPGVIFTYSRGAMLGLPVVIAMVFLKGGRHRLLGLTAAGLAGLVFLLIAPFVVPAKWWDRMATIQTYDEDGSAQSRLAAWRVATRLARDRPLVGGGFLVLEREGIHDRYGNPGKSHSAHSIYFSMLGDHGFVGLALFVGMLVSCLWSLFRLRLIARTLPDGDWLRNYALMLEASLVVYMVTGAFLTLAYFDLVYHIVSFVILLRVLAAEEVAAQAKDLEVPPPAWSPRVMPAPVGS